MLQVRKDVIIYSLFVYISAIVIFLILISLDVGGKTIVVDDNWNGADFHKIQDAIDEAEEGDRIRVYKGIYNEVIEFNKDVPLIGNGSSKTRIHATGTGFAIDFVSNGRFTGFNVTMASGPMMPRLMGANRIDNSTFHTGSIFIHYCGGFEIDNCTFWETGLNFDGAGDCRIVKNTFHRSSIVGWGATNAVVELNRFLDNKSAIGFGVETSNVTIQRNRLNGANIGFSNIDMGFVINNKLTDGSIYVGMGSDATIMANTITGQGAIGLGSYILEELLSHDVHEDNTINGRPVMYYKSESDLEIEPGPGQVIMVNCSWARIEGITLNSSFAGFTLDYCDNSTISNCTFDGNLGAGLSSRYSENMTLFNCTFKDLYGGIYIPGWINSTVEQCSFIDLDAAIDLSAWSRDVRITRCIIEHCDKGIITGNPTVDLRIDNCTITGDPDAPEDDPNDGITTRWSTHITIENTTLTNTTGINFSEADHSVVRNVRMLDCVGRFDRWIPEGGLNIGKTEYLKVSNVTITGAGVSMLGDMTGRYPREWSTHWFNDVTVNGLPLGYFQNQSGVLVGPGYGQVIVVNCSGALIEDLVFNDTFIPVTFGMSDNCTIHGLEINDAIGPGVMMLDAENMTFRNGTVLDTEHGSGLFIVTGRDLTFEGIDVSGSEKHGIDIGSSLRIDIEGCNLSGNEQSGLNLQYSDHGYVGNCSMHDNGEGAISGSGGMLTEDGYTINRNRLGGSEDGNPVLKIHMGIAEVTNNRITGSNGSGIKIWSLKDSSFRNNVIRENDGHGIEAVACRHMNISSNLIADNGGYGIHITSGTGQGADGNLIFANKFKGNGNFTSQGFDDGTGNEWDDNVSSGNWWSDLNGTDVDGNGIGDDPYYIDGDGNRKDRWPTGKFNGSYWKRLYVDDDNVGDPDMDGSILHPFSTIQAAIYNASMMTKIMVWEGDYHENLLVNQSYLWFIGNGSSNTTVDGNGIGTVVELLSPEQTIQGFRITNSGNGAEDSGVHTDGFENVTIANCIIDDDQIGIMAENTANVTIMNCTIFDDQTGIVIDASTVINVTHTSVYENSNSGMYLTDIVNLTINDGSTASAHGQYGVYLNGVEEADISSVTANNNTNAGIQILGSGSITIISGLLHGNSAGISVSDSDEVSILSSVISDPTGDGISFTGSSDDFLVDGCSIDGSNDGISIQSCDGTIGNTSISGSDSNDIDLSAGSEIVSINVTFGSIACDLTSEAVIKNYLTVYTKNQHDEDLRDVDVKITEDSDTVYATEKYGGSDDRTDRRGVIDPVLLIDRIYDGSSTASEIDSEARVSFDEEEYDRDIDMSTTHTELFEFQNVNTAPNISISRPTEGKVLDGIVKVRGTAEDRDGVDQIKKVEVAWVQKGVEPDGDDWKKAADTSGDGSWSSWKQDWNRSSWEDGKYVIHARAYDGKVHSRTAMVNVTLVNQDLPTIKINSPEEGETVSGTYTVKGKASDQDTTDNVTKVEVAVKPEGEEPDTDDWQAASDTSDSGEAFSKWSYKWKTGSCDDGNHTVYARAISSDGNVSMTYSVNVTVENNNSRPTVMIHSPGETDEVNTMVVVNGTMTDEDDDIDLIQVSFDDDTFSSGKLMVSFEQVGWDRWNWTAEWDLSTTEVGTHTLFARATDDRGMESRIWMVNITIFNTPPMIDLISLSGANRTVFKGESSTFMIRWSDLDIENNASIRLYRDDNAVHGDGTEYQEVLIVDDLYEDTIDRQGEEVDAFNWNISGLKAGGYYIFARIDDGVNDPVINYTAHRLILEDGVPNTAPKIEIGPGIDRSIEVLETFRIDIDASDPDDDPLTVHLYLDNDTERSNGVLIQINSEPLDENTTYKDLLISGIVPGSYHILARADDGMNSTWAYASGTLTVVPMTRPGPVLELRCEDAGFGDALLLEWRAPGDDNYTGRASHYLIRYSLDPILTSDDWDSAEEVDNDLEPLSPLMNESLLVRGLGNDYYYFAVRAVDDEGKVGRIPDNGGGRPTMKVNWVDAVGLPSGFQCQITYNGHGTLTAGALSSDLSIPDDKAWFGIHLDIVGTGFYESVWTNLTFPVGWRMQLLVDGLEFYRYDATGTWQLLDRTGYDDQNGKVWAKLDHLSIFAPMTVPIPDPTLSELTVTPDSGGPGEEYVFEMTFTDEHERIPNVRIIVEGEAIDLEKRMVRTGSDPSVGLRFKWTLDASIHRLEPGEYTAYAVVNFSDEGWRTDDVVLTIERSDADGVEGEFPYFVLVAVIIVIATLALFIGLGRSARGRAKLEEGPTEEVYMVKEQEQ